MYFRRLFSRSAPPAPIAQQHSAAVKIQRAWKQWRSNESALLHMPAELAPSPALTHANDRLIDVCAKRQGQHFWHFDDGQTTRGALSSPTLQASHAQLNELRQNGFWTPPDRPRANGYVRTAMRPWLYSADREERRAAAKHVFDANYGLNCTTFVLSSLYAAGLTSRGAIQAALDPRDMPGQPYRALGFQTARSVNAYTPQSGDILFYVIDNCCFHVLIAAEAGKAYEIGSDIHTAYRVRKVTVGSDGTAISTASITGELFLSGLRVRVCPLHESLHSLRHYHRQQVDRQERELAQAQLAQTPGCFPKMKLKLS